MNYHGEEINFGRQRMFEEPRCYTFAAVSASTWIGLGGLALTGASVGLAASGAGQPVQPNLAASSQALSNANAQLLPLQRGFEAAQQTGGDYSFSLPQGFAPAQMGIATTGQGWFDANGNLISTDPNYLQSPEYKTKQLLSNLGNLGKNKTGQPATPPPQPTWHPGTTTMNGVPVTQNKDGSYTVSFKGKGQGDIQTQIANQQAKDQLALSQEMDPKFIAAALQQQAEADPESVAARARESELIQDQINRPLNSPVSDMLNSQVQDTLNAANNNTLTDLDTQRLNDATGAALAARGGGGPGADFAQPLTSGFAGEQRRSNAAQGADAFLASGSSPEDIAYRREQQNLANLGDEVAGKSPQSQFGAMSGAQSGATPIMTGAPLSVLPGGQDQGAQQVAIQNAQTTNRFNNNQVNPWMLGLSSLINVGSVAGGMGWKPFS